MNYARFKGDLARRISLSIGFGQLRERLSDWDGDRRIMKRSRERKNEDIDKNPPNHFSRRKEDRESAISAKSDSYMGDLEFAQEEQSAPTKDRDEEKKRNEF